MSEVTAATRRAHAILVKGDALDIGRVPPADRPRLLDLVQGVRRHEMLLDSVLDAFLERAPRHLLPPVHAALRLGVYELLFRERAPVAGVVSQAVELVGRFRKMRGLVNAVLRRIAEERVVEEGETDGLEDRAWIAPGRRVRFERPILPALAEDPEGRAVAEYSVPEWFVKRLAERFEDFEAILRALSTPLPPRLRPLPPYEVEQLASELKAAGLPVRATEGGCELPSGVVPGDLPCLTEGRAIVQDLVPSRVADALRPAAGERWLDLCASPGGKSAVLGRRLPEGARLVSADLGPRLPRLRETLRRCGLDGSVAVHDLGKSGRKVPDGPFDGVLVDAPCSNSGVLMKRAEARSRVKAGPVTALTARQDELLRRAADLLRPGSGRLYYATCSILSAENEERVEELLEERDDLELLSEELWLPHRTGRDGGYLAVLRRTGSDG